MTSSPVSRDSGRTRLAVLGSPIGHSLSPKLHTAAYAALGLSWDYQAVEVTGDSLPDFLETCDAHWRGLSLTMPLKRDIVPLLDAIDQVADLTGVVNTVLFTDAGRRGFNTDVAGITRALESSGVLRLRDVVILGGGATAASAMVAARDLGAISAHVWMRNPGKAAAIHHLAERLGIQVQLSAFTEADGAVGHPDAVFSTLPNGSVVDLVFAEAVRRNSVLFDVAYDPWPTPLATAWQDVGGRVVSGLDMLVNQALVQVRIFVSGDPAESLPGEASVLEAMWGSVARGDSPS